MGMKVWVAAATLVALATPAAAEKRLAGPAAKAIDALAATFFSHVKAGEVREAYAATLTARPFQEKKAEIDALAAQVTGVVKTYGAVYGWERVNEDQKSPYDAVAVYELRLSTVPLFFRMNFYRRDDASPWAVTKISFSDSDDVSIK